MAQSRKPWFIEPGQSDRFGPFPIGSPEPRFHHHLLQYLMDYHTVLGKTFMGFSLNLGFVRQHHPQRDQESCDSGCRAATPG
jgi:hypothetical protein